MSLISIREDQRNEFEFADDWRAYYRQRRTILRRLIQFASIAAILIALADSLPEPWAKQHGFAMDAIGGLGALGCIAAVIQWFRLNWVLGGWICPRCREMFFRSSSVRNPFG